MKLIPLHDWAVIVPSEAETRTAGGLYIPDTAKEKPEEGVVEAIGPGAYEEEKESKKKDEKKERKFVPTKVKPGDRVLYERYAGQTYKINNEERILVRERSILGLIDRPPRMPAVTTPKSAIKEHPGPSSPMSAPKAKTPGKASKKKTKKVASKKKASKKTAKKAVRKTAKKAAKAKGKKAGRKRSEGQGGTWKTKALFVRRRFLPSWTGKSRRARTLRRRQERPSDIF